MAITSTLTTSFKKELLEAVHNFKNSGGDTFKLALYTSSATLGATTTAFTTTGQASGTNYTSGFSTESTSSSTLGVCTVGNGGGSGPSAVEYDQTYGLGHGDLA